MTYLSLLFNVGISLFTGPIEMLYLSAMFLQYSDSILLDTFTFSGATG